MLQARATRWRAALQHHPTLGGQGADTARRDAHLERISDPLTASLLPDADASRASARCQWEVSGPWVEPSGESAFERGPVRGCSVRGEHDLDRPFEERPQPLRAR